MFNIFTNNLRMNFNFTKRLLIILSSAVLFSGTAFSQYVVDDDKTAAELVSTLTGEGVTIISSTLNCAGGANGTFEGVGDLGIDEGIVLTSGSASGSVGAYAGWGNPSVNNSRGGDVDLNTVLAGLGSADACVLQFRFVPAGDTIKFNYVFGSAEYGSYSCSSFNDIFGFFITGGAYATPQNLAVIPGTTIPICVNSTTGVPAIPGAMCTDMGAGSPFSEYYIDNTAGAFIKYGGFTTVFQAIAAVNPCDTYTLKLAIGDGSTSGTDGILDSGVFLEGGSLSSPSLEIETAGGDGDVTAPEKTCVRGCETGRFSITRSGSLGAALPVIYELSGSAVNGFDYSFLTGTALIPAGLSTVDVIINPLVLADPDGDKVVIITVYNPYECTEGEGAILARDSITILDSLFLQIPQNDTVVCTGTTMTLDAIASDLVDVLWTASDGTVFPDPTLRTITVTPTVPTIYTVTGSYPGSDCPTLSRSVFIDFKEPPVVTFASNQLMCLGGTTMLDPIITPEPDGAFTYSWTPTAGLDDPTAMNPNASPAMTTNYTLEVNPGAAGCSGFGTVTVSVLPNNIELLNTDISVCAGTVVPLLVNGHPAFSYYWTPETYIVDPHAMNTAITATESGLVTVIASHPGCDDMPQSFYLDVQPTAKVDLGPDITLCSGDTAQLYVGTTPEYAGYTYQWSPGMKLTDSTIKNPVFNGFSSERYIVSVTTPEGCEGRDTLNVTVNSSNFANVNIRDTAICPPAFIQLEATGGISYRWEPSYGLDHDSIANPIATPAYTTNYLLHAMGANGCVDTIHVDITVNNDAVISLPDSTHIWPGEKYEMDLVSNAHYFSWFPPEGLTATNIANPVASPDVRTRYYVRASTEDGCSTIDSIDVIVHLESVFDIPNAFVPGNDFANNSTFKIGKRGDVVLNKFEIYNRWGNLVFSTTDINEGWDGTFKGEIQPMGVYVYVIEGTLNTGRKIQMSGNVTLIR